MRLFLKSARARSRSAPSGVADSSTAPSTKCMHGVHAYSYTVGQPWKSYNAEQQASIIEDWFSQGQLKTGPLYPYIVNHVQKGDC